MLRKVAKAVAVLVVFTFLGLLMRDYWWRCSSTGLDEQVARNIAEEKVKRYGQANLALQYFQKDGSDWTFSYAGKDCIVHIVVDRCGIADIGGQTHRCP